MTRLVNNAHYRVDLSWDLNAEGGGNPGGRVVHIHKKRTGERMTIPLNLWRKFNALVELGANYEGRVGKCHSSQK